MEQTIQVNKVCKRLGQRAILRDVSFEAEPGRVTAFLGPNGAGKSSTLRILLGLDRADSGTAKLGGRYYAEFEDPLRTVGASFDGVGSPNDRTVYQHLRIAAASNGLDRSSITAVLAVTGILHQKQALVGNLSLGEGQRLGIATALLGDPQFLIFDEPTNGLDPSGIRWFRAFIRDQAQRGKTVLWSSHMLSEVESAADDVVIINNGEIIEKGDLKSIVRDSSSLESVFFKLTDGQKK